MTAFDLSHSPGQLMETTMDQLRTLVAVRDTGSALGAARLLNRDPSSVQKQIDTLNRNFGAMCGEPLVLKRGRGQGVAFTESGESLVETARDTLTTWQERIFASRRRVGGTLSVGATVYTLAAVTRAGAEVASEFLRRDIRLRIEHIRSGDILAKLRDKELDVVCGSIALDEGGGPPVDVVVSEWSRRTLSVLTNLSPEELPGPEVASSELPGLPLVVPDRGLIADSLRGWFGADCRRRLRIAAEIDAVAFGLELLGSELPLRGCMLVTRGIGEMIRDGRMAGGGSLRVLPIRNDTEARMEVLSGAFMRAADEPADPAHPLSLLWRAMEAGDAR